MLLNNLWRGVKMFFGTFMNNKTSQVTEQIDKNDLRIIEKRILDWLVSPERYEQITGERYYLGRHDILDRKRQAIGEDGELIQINNLPNNKIIDNQYRKLVDQKTNFLLGQKVVFDSENEKYLAELQNFFDESFDILLKSICIDSLNCGVAWVHPYYDQNGEFKIKRISPYEILPIWTDSEKTTLDMAIRLYEIKIYENGTFKIQQKVEIYKSDGVSYYDFINNQLKADTSKQSGNYFNMDGNGYNWGRIPLIAFRYNRHMIPLIRDLKSLQDALNMLLSDWQNNLQEDSRNSILILKNYDGANLGEFRQNLATYGAVKIREDGDVSLLKTEMNAENYKMLAEIKKREMTSIARGYDAAELRAGNNPNELQIKSVFNDINMDANGMELEFKFALNQLLWFINANLSNTNKGDYFKETVDIIFNKDQIVNEGEVINDIKNSVGIVSTETLLKNHPYVDDVKQEEEQLKKENDVQEDSYFSTGSSIEKQSTRQEGLKNLGT